MVDKWCPHIVNRARWTRIFLFGMVDDDLETTVPQKKRNCSERLCTAEVKVARPSKVAAKQLHRTRLRFLMTGRCAEASCKFDPGLRELKQAPDLKKTKLRLKFSQGCCLKSAACSFAHSWEDLRVTASVYKTAVLFLRTRFLQDRSVVQTRARSREVAMFIRHAFTVADFGTSSPAIPALGRSPSRGVS